MIKLLTSITSLLLFTSFSINKNFTPINSDIRLKAEEALSYCQNNKLNTNICILINMNIHSGKNRFFLYNFKTQKIINTGLCTHGCCDSEWGTDSTKMTPTFSNEPNSHCSSLGKYKIGVRGYSNWGININYKLHGLEKTNNKAYKRTIVLHSWDMISDTEIFPYGAPEGWGCPAISNKLLKQIDPILKKETTPLLLWIYKN